MYKGDVDLEMMRRSGRILAETLRYIESGYIVPGLSTLDISNKTLEIITSFEGASAAFLGYRGFTGASCVSVNQQVVHAVPRADIVIRPGDIVSVDCGVIYNGHYTDACRTVCVEPVDPRAKKLVKATYESLNCGINAAKAGDRIGDISYAIQNYIERKRFQVSQDYVGHGIGRILHADPQVPNYGPPNKGPLIKAGDCFAIEPVVFDGPTATFLEPDGWTVMSSHNVLSAHFEDTIIITAEGPEIITRIKE